MPNLHDELLGETRSGACKLCVYLSRLDPVVRGEWQAEIALPKETVSHTAIMVALKRRGVSIEEASVRRHRSNHV
jgi:hypothetical protein